MISEVTTSQKAIAITFDDGPNPIYTPQVMDILLAANAKATFFVVGEQVEKNPEIVKRAYAEGHEIGNHTYTHPKLSQLPREQCLEEIKRNEKMIKSLIGHNPVVFRPPFLDCHQELASILGEKGYSMIGALNLEAQD